MSSQALFLDAGAEATFATVHLPALTTAQTTGVVLCPAFGWDDLCSYRARIAWAESLAVAGHPAVRFDLPGTGDSAGSPREPDRVSAWIASTAAAASWLRDDAGCQRIVGLGIGLGGMLALMAAAEGAPIDDFVLWAAPTKGRRLVRAIAIAAKMSLDTKFEFELPDMQSAPSRTYDDDILVDEAGQINTRETLDALSTIDLTTLSLAHPESRRVLLLERSGMSEDQQLGAHFTKIGAEVTVANGDDFEPMMRYVQESEIPVAAIARTVSWLAEARLSGSDLPGVATKLSSYPVRGVTSIELKHDGVTIRETLVTLQVTGRPIRGVITEPVDAPAVDLCAAFFGGGSDRRIGPNRMWVDTSRRWASRGVTAVRFDPPGIGDSDGDSKLWDELPAHYNRRHVADTVALLNALEDYGVPNRFVLTGFCSGAFRSFQVSLRDERIAGVFTVGMPFFFWSWWAVHVRDWWMGEWKPRKDDRRLKIVLFRTAQQALRVVQAGRRLIVRFAHRYPDRADVALELLRDRQVEVLLLFKLGSKEYTELVANGHMARLRRMHNVRAERIPGDDTRFRPLPLQECVNDALDSALMRVLRPGETESSPPLAPAESVGKRAARRTRQLFRG